MCVCVCVFVRKTIHKFYILLTLAGPCIRSFRDALLPGPWDAGCCPPAMKLPSQPAPRALARFLFYILNVQKLSEDSFSAVTVSMCIWNRSEINTNNLPPSR